MLLVNRRISAYALVLGNQRVKQQIVVDEQLRVLVNERLHLDLLFQGGELPVRLKGQLDHLTGVQIEDVDVGELTDLRRVLEELGEGPHGLVVVLHQAGEHGHQQRLQTPRQLTRVGQLAGVLDLGVVDVLHARDGSRRLVLGDFHHGLAVVAAADGSEGQEARRHMVEGHAQTP